VECLAIYTLRSGLELASMHSAPDWPATRERRLARLNSSRSRVCDAFSSFPMYYQSLLEWPSTPSRLDFAEFRPIFLVQLTPARNERGSPFWPLWTGLDLSEASSKQEMKESVRNWYEMIRGSTNKVSVRRLGRCSDPVAYIRSSRARQLVDSALEMLSGW